MFRLVTSGVSPSGLWVCVGWLCWGELTISGLVNLRNRDYDPTSGTFTTTDPIDGRPGQTTVANAYAYVGNDPLNYTDPLGLCRVDDVGFQMSVSDPDAEARVIGGGTSALTLEQCESTPTVTCENLGTGSDTSAPVGDFYSYTTTYSCGPAGPGRDFDVDLPFKLPCFNVPFYDNDCDSYWKQWMTPPDTRAELIEALRRDQANFNLSVARGAFDPTYSCLEGSSRSTESCLMFFFSNLDTGLGAAQGVVAYNPSLSLTFSTISRVVGCSSSSLDVLGNVLNGSDGIIVQANSTGTCPVFLSDG